MARVTTHHVSGPRDGTQYGSAVIRHSLANVTLVAKRLYRNHPPAIVAITFGIIKRFEGHRFAFDASRSLASTIRALSNFLDGRKTPLETIRIDLSGFTPFQRDVLNAAGTIPWGTTLSYGELAAASGHPTAVRAAASVMRNNRFPLIVPCHRVVAAGGTIGGFCGHTSGRMVELKRKLLSNEGIELHKR